MKLKPCPGCGYREPFVAPTKCYNDPEPWYEVYCDGGGIDVGCGFRGPKMPTEDLAAAAWNWNRRRPPTEEEVEARLDRFLTGEWDYGDEEEMKAAFRTALLADLGVSDE